LLQLDGQVTLPLHAPGDPQSTEQPQDVSQWISPAQASLPHSTSQNPCPQVMLPLQADSSHLTVHAPLPQMMLPVQELWPQVMVQSWPLEQLMLPWQLLFPQLTVQSQPEGQAQPLEQESSHTPPLHLLTQAPGQLCVSGGGGALSGCSDLSGAVA
jgi:hypothetical protein